MGRYAVLVMGPAGSGKSTFCAKLLEHMENEKRRAHLVNLDPAAEHFDVQPTVDLRELISLQDVEEELDLGPNGGMIYCYEYLMDNTDWLEEQIANYDEEYLIFDLPGQIELYTHFPLVSRIAALLQQWDFHLCGVYLLESQFIQDRTKFFAGVLSAMSAMISLEIPHVNVISKMDLIKEGRGGVKRRMELERYLDPDPHLLIGEINEKTNPRFHALNQTIVQLIDDFNLVSFLALDITEEDSIGAILSHIDNALQFGEDEEVKPPKDLDEGDFADMD